MTPGCVYAACVLPSIPSSNAVIAVHPDPARADADKGQCPAARIRSPANAGVIDGVAMVDEDATPEPSGDTASTFSGPVAVGHDVMFHDQVRATAEDSEISSAVTGWVAAAAQHSIRVYCTAETAPRATLVHALPWLSVTVDSAPVAAPPERPTRATIRPCVPDMTVLMLFDAGPDPVTCTPGVTEPVPRVSDGDDTVTAVRVQPVTPVSAATAVCRPVASASAWVWVSPELSPGNPVEKNICADGPEVVMSSTHTVWEPICHIAEETITPLRPYIVRSRKNLGV